VNLDAIPSDDAKNTRPGVVVSPDEMNRNVDHVIIAPLASTNTRYPTRVPVEFLNSERMVILDQIRTVDKDRLVKKVGVIGESSQGAIIERLGELFAK
jgi:mRNA interferase MazF